MNRVLLIHFGQLGDSVMALPAALALRAHFAQAELTVLASRGGHEIFRMAGFDDIWMADRVRWKARRTAALPEIVGLVAKVRRRHFDLSVDLHSFHETNLLAWAGGVKKRVAMLRPTRSLPRLITHQPPADDPDARLVDRYCRVLEPLGIEVKDRTPRLFPQAPVSEFAAWAKDEPVLGVCPGAGNAGRRWPAGRFAELVRERREPVAVFAGPEEDEATLARFAGMPAVRIWRGLAIAELAAALARCRVVVTNATGPSHIAAAVGASVLTLGEIPAFDPVAVAPGRVVAVRAERVVGDITIERVREALADLWT
ncbi:MAG TPA: glycosyltransferase family 9 protein [Terriglobales bacterium]|nr:glycosyltransferase family 9 protein [Terriglobales bacterium]